MASSKGTVGNLLVQMRMELGQLRTDVKELNNTFTGAFSSIKSAALEVGAVLGIGFSVAGVIAFGKELLSLGDKLQDLGDRTGISVQTLSGIKSTLEENGSSLEDFSLGVSRAQKNLGALDPAANKGAKALEALGLSVKEMMTVSPDEFLNRFITALGGVENQNRRVALATDVMGRSAMNLIPSIVALVGHLDELKNKGLTPQQVKTLDDASDAMTRLKNATQLFAAGALAQLVAELDMVFNVSNRSQLLNSLIAIQDEIDRIDKMLAARATARTQPFGFLVNPDDATQLERKKKLLAEQQKIDAQLNQLNAPTAAAKTSVVVPASSKIEDAQKRAAEAAARFTEAIAKQVTGLDAQVIALSQGEEAANKYKLQQDLIEAKTRLTADLMASKVPGAAAMVARAFASIDTDALAKGLTAAQKELAATTFRFKEIDDAIKNMTEESPATPEFLASIRDTIAQRGAEAIALAGTIRANAGGPDDIERNRVLNDYVDTLTKISESNLSAQESTELFAIALGKVNKELSQIGLDARLSQIDVAAQVLGPDFDAVGAKINEVTSEIKRLIAEGLTPLDPQLQALQTRLGTLQLQESFDKMATSISQSVGTTLNGIMQGTQGIKDGIKNLGRNILLGIANAITDATLVKPIEKMIKDFGKGLADALGEGILNGLNSNQKSLGEQIGRWLGDILNNVFGNVGGSSGGLGFAGAGALGSLFNLGGSSGAAGAMDWMAGLLNFDTGGMVPGPVGTPQLAVVHGGENVVRGGAGRGGDIYIDARGSQRGVSREIQEAILQSENRAVNRSVVAVKSARARSNNYAHGFGRS